MSSRFVSGFGRRPAATERGVDGGVDAVVEGLGTGLPRLSDDDVPQPPVGLSHAQVQEQPGHRVWADLFDDAAVADSTPGPRLNRP